jgi:hypothetical protein
MLAVMQEPEYWDPSSYRFQICPCLYTSQISKRDHNVWICADFNERNPETELYLPLSLYAAYVDNGELSIYQLSSKGCSYYIQQDFKSDDQKKIKQAIVKMVPLFISLFYFIFYL